MIHFKKLKYKNILSTGNVPIEIDLDTHNKTLFMGTNGHGKSTSISALTFALFGRDYRGINKPLLVNSINKKNLLVEVEFETNGKNYVIKRGIKPAIFEIYLDGSLLNQSSSARDYQKYIEENVLKFNFNAFKQIIVLDAKSHTPFMLLPAAQRREIIEDLLDLSVFSRMNILLKEKLSTCREEIMTIEGLVAVENEKQRVLAQHLEKIKKESHNKREELFVEINKLRTENEEKDKQLTLTLSEVELLRSKQTKMLEVEKKKLQVNSAITMLEARQETFTNTIRFYESNDNCPTCHQDISAEFKGQSIVEAKTHHAECESKLTKLKDGADKIKRALALNNEINSQLQAKITAISKLQGEIHSNHRYITMLEVEVEKALTDNAEQASINKQIDDIQKKIKQLDKQKETLINDREVQLYALSLLKDSGIKTKIIQTYIPMMNKLINGFLSSMEFYVNFELDESFNEVIKSRHRDEFSYANFSAGEKQRIDLAILFTWRQIAKLRNNMATNILFLDEVGDSSLDDAGVQDLMAILDIQKDTNIFMISHKEQMIDKVDRVLKFEKTNNFTTVKEV